jgi:hypothetical protein
MVKEPLIRRVTWPCQACGHPIAAVSQRALLEAMEEHADYVNATKDRDTDDHFEAVRVQELLS